jgi:Cu/Ag efflux pump CusA
VLSLGSYLGLVAVVSLGMRNAIMLIRHFQLLERQETGERNGVVLRGTGERLPAVVAAAVILGLIALPFAALGNIAGLEILHPAAVAMLGGLVTSTLQTVFVIPSLYTRFAATAVAGERSPLAEAA